MSHPALDWPPPFTDAETHLKLMADAGTVVQPLSVGELAPTLRVHLSPLRPCVIFQLIIATESPATVLPGLFAINEIVLGVARNWLTAVNP